MGSPTIYKELIDGRLVVVRPRRGYVEAKVYAGQTEDTELLGDWEMPNMLRHELDTVAALAARQTPPVERRR